MGRILVIDDEVEVRDLIARILEGAEHDVVTAANGDEGLKLYDAASVDLVITDIIMPEKEGVQTIMELLAENADARIIAISGGGRITPEDHLKTADLLGARVTLAKPFSRADLLEAVDRAMA